MIPEQISSEPIVDAEILDEPDTNFAINLVSPLPRRWHPKITPYRFGLLLTTTILGALKAVAAYRGQTFVSTTLEWISGVALSLTFYFLSYYDEIEDQTDTSCPKYLSWFFTYDCMTFLWRILSLLSIPHPAYQTHSRRTLIRSYEYRPSITGYRMLVSVVVTTFGTVKVACGYLGQNTTANSADWALGVVASSLLYIIGLYECNTVDLAPAFFEEDYSRLLRRSLIFAFSLVFYGTGISICVIWSAFASRTLLKFIKEPFALAITANGLTPRLIDDLHDLSLKIMTSAAMMLISALGIGGLILMLWLVKRAIIPKGLVHPVFQSARRAVLSVLHTLFAWQGTRAGKGKEGSNYFLEQALTYSLLTTRICVHILGHLLAVASFSLLGFGMFGFSLRLWYSIDHLKDGVLESVMKVFYVGVVAVNSLSTLILFPPVFSSLVKPWYFYWKSDFVAFQYSLKSP